MKNKKLIISASIIIFIMLIAFLKYILDKEPDYSKYKDDFPLLNSGFTIPLDSYCSCIGFSENHEFYEFDCDSEPSGMAFTGEFYDKYYYDNKTKNIIFTSNEENMPPIKAKILEITDFSFTIKVLNDNTNDENCAIDKKHTYKYYMDSATMKGSELKKHIKKLSKEGVKIIYSEYCNKEININSKYHVEYLYGKNHKLISIYIEDTDTYIDLNGS